MSGPTRVPSSSAVRAPVANTRPLMQPRLDTSTESLGIFFSVGSWAGTASIHATSSTTLVIIRSRSGQCDNTYSRTLIPKA